MKINITVANRIRIPTMFPPTGTFEDFIVRKDIQKKLDLTQDDLKKYNIKSSVTKDGNTTVTWNDKSAVVEIEFTDMEIDFLKGILTQLNEENRLPMDFDTANLYSQIVHGKLLDA